MLGKMSTLDPQKTDAVSQQTSVPLRSFVRNVATVSATALIVLIMVFGNDWRGGPPATWEFVVPLAIASIGFASGCGVCLDRHSNPIPGFLSIFLCGWFLIRILSYLIAFNSLRGFAW